MRNTPYWPCNSAIRRALIVSKSSSAIFVEKYGAIGFLVVLSETVYSIQGHFGPQPIRPRVVSALDRFGLVSFQPGLFRPARFDPGLFRLEFVDYFGFFLPLTRVRYIGTVVESIKYLGVTITNNLRWNTHVSNVCTKANGLLERPENT